MAIDCAPTEVQLLEREHELAVLADSLTGARLGRGRMLFVAGDAGAGKTSLVRAFITSGTGRTRVLFGYCDALSTPRPLGPFLDVGRDGELPHLVQRGAPPGEVFDALDRLLSVEPTVVVLEDLHWADEATLDMLRMLGQRVGDMGCLVVATYREEQTAGDHLRMVLGDLVTNRSIRRLSLQPLSREAVAALAESHGVDPDRLHQVSGGNPFFVTEVLAAGGEHLPQTVRDAVFARGARLSEPARTLLGAIAVIPASAELWLLEAIAGAEIEHLEECNASGMVTTQGTRVMFRHEIARVATEEALPLRRRVALHRCVLEALIQRSDDASLLPRLAHHADAADDRQAVLRYAPAAARRAGSVGAHREAAALFEQALRCADHLDPRAKGGMLREFSVECYMTDHGDAAIRALEDAIEIYRGLGDRLAEGDMKRRLSEILWCPGRGREARRIGDEAVAILESVGARAELVLAYLNRSLQCRMEFDAAQAVVWAGRAARMAAEVGDRVLETTAMMSLGCSEALLNPERPPERLQRAYEVARTTGSRQLTGDCLELLGEAAANRRDYPSARSYLESASQFATDHGLELTYLYAVAHQARLQLDVGNWDEAAMSAEQLLRQRFVSTFPRTIALCVLGLVRARRGDPDAGVLIDEADDLARSTGELARMAIVAAASAELAWTSDRVDSIEALTDEAFAVALARQASRIAGELARWRARAGVVDDIPDWLAGPDALELARDWRRAADGWASLGCPYEAALARANAGDEQSLRDALDELRELRALPASRIVMQRLRRRGARGVARGPRPATRENPAGLTGREVDVLRLLSEGFSNTAIAQRLFVSRRTVDHHVSAILRKLEVDSRSAALSATAKRRLLEDA